MDGNPLGPGPVPKLGPELALPKPGEAKRGGEEEGGGEEPYAYEYVYVYI